MNGVFRAVVWLDRDGTIVDDPGYLREAAEVRLLPGAARAIARLNDAGATVILVSNQSGIGRGLLDEDDFHAVQAEIARQLAVEGAHLDDVRFCPHLPSKLLAPGQAPCACRKPRPGMVQAARRELGIAEDLPQVVVGDKEADVGMARALGVAGVLVLTGEGRETLAALDASGAGPDHVADDLAAALPWILSELGLADPASNC